jgi:DNA repair exonuclease SbcCD ATPase subunit
MAEHQSEHDRAPSKLPLLEAAQRMGKSTEAVRALIRRGRIEAVRGNDGRLLVAVPSELVRPDDRTSPNDRTDSDQLARALIEREEALAELDQLRERAHEAELAHARVEAELKVRLEQLDGLKAELVTRQERLDALNGELATVHAELVEARRPWWRRWVG